MYYNFGTTAKLLLDKLRFDGKVAVLMKNYEFHPICEIFPLLEGEEFASLVESVKEQGLLNDIWLDRDDKIIDGRNRYRACLKAAVEPRFQTYKGNDLLAFVISQNIDRRQLDSIGRAEAGYRAIPFMREQAKARQREAGGDRRSVASKIDASGPEERAPVATQMAADMVGSNREYVQTMVNLHEEGLGNLLSLVLRRERSIPSVAAEAREYVRRKREEKEAAEQKLKEVTDREETQKREREEKQKREAAESQAKEKQRELREAEEREQTAKKNAAKKDDDSEAKAKAKRAEEERKTKEREAKAAKQAAEKAATRAREEKERREKQKRDDEEKRKRLRQEQEEKEKFAAEQAARKQRIIKLEYEIVSAGRRELAKKTHPDHQGGTNSEMVELNEAAERIKVLLDRWEKKER